MAKPKLFTEEMHKEIFLFQPAPKSTGNGNSKGGNLKATQITYGKKNGKVTKLRF